MKKRKNYFWWGLLGFLLLAVLCLVAYLLYSFWMDKRAFNSRPLVLIHSPYNHDQVRVGERLLIHASARADNGLDHMELWVDDTLVATQEAPEADLTTLVLSSDWLVNLEGNHVVVVRAVATNGVEGQSSISIEALEYAVSGTWIHTVQESETVESIALFYGTTPEEIEALNPGMDPGGVAAGDDLVVPGGGSGEDGGESVEEEEPASDAEPPEAEVDAPSFFGFVEEFFLMPFLERFGPEPEVLTLRLEIPSLYTGATYDGLHCYVELAGSLPQWYPDLDFDQATDESFASMEDGWWDTSTQLVGGSAPAITWNSDEPLPLAVTCVGVAGGMEALELGRVELSIPPEDWNGIIHEIEGSGSDGRFAFTYRVSRQESPPSGVPMFLDPDMTPPINAHLDDRRISLRWDYFPEEDEEPIDGFRIYLNGNLQWTEPPGSRESGLPYEWFNPPCGSTYTFAVTAFRVGFPDGPESLPSIAIKSQPLEGCTREIQIVFVSLETFDLGSDGRYEDRHGDVGPAYGYYFANEKQITFSGGHLGAGLDMPNGLRHNTVYDLSSMSADRTWNFSGMNGTIVDIVPGGTFEFGFHIMDEDSGHCHDSGDPGCDDLICEGLSMIYIDHYGEFDRNHEGAITSEDGRCRVTFAWGPAFGSPVGSGEPGWEPLPWINMQDFSVDEATGKVQITVRNTGTATWPWKDLTIELQTREGSSLGLYTWPDFVLETGQETVLEQAGMVLDAPYDACVVIDPFDDVQEEYERSGALYHNPICPRRPDLTITDVSFDPTGGGRVRVTVQNIGDVALENRTVAFGSALEDGSPAYLNRSWPNISLEPRATRTFDLTGVTETVRALLANGYSITVNPDGLVSESNMDNNTFTVRGATTMVVRWCDTIVPHYYGYGHTVRMDMTLDAITGSTSHRLMSERIEDYFSYIYIYDYDTHYIVGDRFPGPGCITLGDIQIFGDERLQVTFSGQYQAGSSGGWDNLSSGSVTLYPTSNWGADVAPECTGYGYSPFDAGGWHDVVVYPDLGMLMPPPWTALFHLCMESGTEP